VKNSTCNKATSLAFSRSEILVKVRQLQAPVTSEQTKIGMKHSISRLTTLKRTHRTNFKQIGEVGCNFALFWSVLTWNAPKVSGLHIIGHWMSQDWIFLPWIFNKTQILRKIFISWKWYTRHWIEHIEV